jgi:rhodanese-related sulfurtransferase
VLHKRHTSRPGKLAAWACTFVLAGVAPADLGSGGGRAFAQASPDQPKPREVEFMTAEALKAKVVGGELVTIIDVRASSYASSEESIKGALRVRLRRLKDRMVQSPFKDLPRDREIVTFCACPADQSGIRAAEVFQQAGFTRVRTLKGGWHAWLAIGGPVENKPTS